MSRRSSTSINAHRAAAALAVAGAITMSAGRASAQACCAGSGAVTPGRLAMHEDALVGLQLRAAHAFGSFDSNGHYSTPPSGSSEQDFEQDLIGAVRMPVVDRLQLAVLVPLVETRRSARGESELGGGFGDVNVSARYDFLYAGQHRVIPGVGVLAGLTLPTGTAPERATQPLATDATGVGAWQGNAGISIEQLFGSWLVTAYGIVATRAARTAQGISTTLGTQWTALVAVAYSFPSDHAIAAFASYTGEGNAEINGTEVAGSSRRVPLVGVSGVVPITDHFRFQGGVSASPPVPSLGKNQPATVGLSVTAVYAWY